MVKISVVMAVFNGEAFIRAQLASIAAQTQLPDEVIVVDDCSLDGTSDLLEFWSNILPLKVVKNPSNRGVVCSFDRGLGMVTGNIVFLCDCDDYWLPTKIEKHMRFHEDRTRQMNLVKSNCSLCDEQFEVWAQTKFERARSLWRKDGGGKKVAQGSLMSFDAALLDLCLPIPEWASSHDTWINLVAKYVAVEHTVMQPLMFYRQHESNFSRNPLNAKHLNLCRRALSFPKFSWGSRQELERSLIEIEGRIDSTQVSYDLLKTRVYNAILAGSGNIGLDDFFRLTKIDCLKGIFIWLTSSLLLR